MPGLCSRFDAKGRDWTRRIHTRFNLNNVPNMSGIAVMLVCQVNLRGDLLRIRAHGSNVWVSNLNGSGESDAAMKGEALRERTGW
jgi:hypothetical protein